MSKSNRAALFSFLRVLAVALASAILPFLTADGSDEVPPRAIITALVSAFLLTVINYFRPGETRFGVTSNSRDGDAGAGEIGMVGTVLLVAGAVALLLVLLDVVALSVEVAVVAIIVGLILLIVDRRRVR